jgi:bidirectional [NiFe] hydrogenase diaphorase subunit
MVTLTIDNIKIKAKKGSNLLWVALDNGFYIPNLCALREFKTPSASCRLCFVEVVGVKSPVASCTVSVAEGMVVQLNSDKVKRIRNTAFELLISHHPVECANCRKNRNCELQNIATKLKLKLKLNRFRQIERNLPIDASHSLFDYNPNKCVLCGRCIKVCQKKGNGTLDFAFRGIKTIVSTFNGIPLSEACDTSCLACVDVCPVGSLVRKIEPGLVQNTKPENCHVT